MGQAHSPELKSHCHHIKKEMVLGMFACDKCFINVRCYY